MWYWIYLYISVCNIYFGTYFPVSWYCMFTNSYSYNPMIWARSFHQINQVFGTPSGYTNKWYAD